MGLFPETAGGMAILLLIVLWTLPWKGYALWLAARLNQKWWFIILLVVNTLAILEIIYIFLIARPAQRHETEEEQSDNMDTE